MILVGEAKVSGAVYYLAVKDSRTAHVYYLISKENLEVADGSAPVLMDVSALRKWYTNEYLIGSLKKLKGSGTFKKFGSVETITNILDAYRFVRSYTFDSKYVSEKEKDVNCGIISERFTADDGKAYHSYVKENGRNLFLSFSYGDVTVSLDSHSFNFNPKLEYEDVPVLSQAQRKLSLATIATIRYDDLAEKLDMSWYKKDGVVVKNYRSVKTKKEFEEYVMTPIIRKLTVAQGSGKSVDIGFDTETTGLNVYDLSPDNPDKDHIVSAQVSWEDNQGVAVFLDMEHFGNVDTKYVMNRFQELFGHFKGRRYIKYWDAGEEKEFCFERNLINLIGHNCMFDGRAVYDTGAEIWFDEDTLQMAFNLNPKIIKGVNKLKVLTRKVFGHETPELSDVLGAGNEDKYRYLVDEEVANIYGCADCDYTRQLAKYLRSIMDESMYVRYRIQDIPLLNILPESEYHGLNMLQGPVQELGHEVYENIQILKNAMYSYVGVYMDYVQKHQVIDLMWDSGYYKSKDEYLKALDAIEPNQNAVYKFEFKASSLRDVLYNIMKYPVFAWTDSLTPLPKVDKYVIKKLLREDADEGSSGRKLTKSILKFGRSYSEYERLLGGSESDKKKAAKMELINKDVFNKKKYPLALIVQKYSDLNKEYTSYFKPILEQNMEGRLFKSYSMTNIETRRISNAAQTMKGSLKALVRSYNDDYYMLDFDMSQIELRLMYSLSGSDVLIKKMCNPENDAHTENGALVNHVPAYKVTKKQRKGAKTCSFGVPYGLGDRSMCEMLFDTINQHNMFETRMVLYNWQKANANVVALLEAARDEALTECKLSLAVRDFIDAWKKDEDGNYVLDENGEKIPVPMGKVTNKYGFYRMFDLSGIDMSPAAKERRASGKYTGPESTIRRAAGNYPIQSFAAEIFRIILIRFYNRCVKEGIADKIIWHMLIHDELLCSVHKSVNPFLLYKIIKESCMITMKGHTKYFVGINVGNTWAECKDDEREAPVYFVDRIVKRYDAGEFRDQTWFDDPWEYVRPYREQYVEDRIGEVMRSIQPGLDSEPINMPLMLEKFQNYTVRAYLNNYSMNRPVNREDYEFAEDYDNAVWQSRIETWALKVFGRGKQIIGVDGVLSAIEKAKEQEVTKEQAGEPPIFAEDLFIEDCEEEDTSYYAFTDDEGADNIYYSESEDLTGDAGYQEEEYKLDLDREGASSFADLVVQETKYKMLQEINGNIVIRTNGMLSVEKAAKEFLARYCCSTDGQMVMFKKAGGILEKWTRVRQETDLAALDEVLLRAAENDCSALKKINRKQNVLYIDLCGREELLEQVKAKFHDFLGSDVLVFFKMSSGGGIWKQVSLDAPLKEIDNFILNGGAA